ncbi:MAG TPA: type I DNA topoisomerase [Candidatus Paceibacterota bacterium]
MNLVIVESPTKAKTIAQFLGKGFIVESSYGHVRDLPKSRLGVDVENNFEPKYIVPLKAKKIVSALKKEAKKSDKIILATDEDREGEAIAWHLVQALGLNPESRIQNPESKVERIVFHEITKSAIEKALQNPRSIDEDRVSAQQARRILDRIVGYKLSPFLWKKVTGGLSAGRVQSVALRLIAERENEIRNFKKEEYWTITASLLKEKETADSIEADLVKIGNRTLEKFALKSKEKAQEIEERLKKCSYSVASIQKKEAKKAAPPPFITSTLQQEAVKRLRFSSKKTMFLAQHLYEKGLITYMRTDSTNLSEESTAAAKKWLESNLGAKYALSAPRALKSKSKLAQEAHEAIRPAYAEETPEKINLTDDGEKKLYELIWRRFIASQMPDALIATTSILISASTADAPKTVYTLRAAGQQIVFDGYLKIWLQKFTEKNLPELSEGEKLALKLVKSDQHFTEPPPRYSEASLIKTLEEYGIGRPSTYAPIISVIQTRNYVKKEAGRFQPTEIGELVNKVLTENFPEVVDIGFTAQMEDEFDEIAAGKVSWQSVIDEFYQPFAKNLAAKYEEVSKSDLIQEKTDEKCDLCGKPMIVKMGRFGKFLACSGFPECKNTKKMANSVAKEPPKKIGLKCPKCAEGDVVERRVSRGRARGKIFWGCSRYPSCDYASWENPLNKNSAS